MNNFSRNHDKTRYHITPLGAAIVEAMPNRKMVAKVKRYFRVFKSCPVSQIFDHHGVMDYYGGTITPMPQHLFRE